MKGDDATPSRVHPVQPSSPGPSSPGELVLLGHEAADRVIDNFDRLARTSRARQRAGGKRTASKDLPGRKGNRLMTRGPLSEHYETPPEALAVPEETLGEVTGPILAEYIINEINKLAIFLEREEGKSRRKGHSALDVLEKLMNESEACDLIERFEARARRLLETGDPAEEAGRLPAIAEEAMHILEDQARHHAIGGVDYSRHKRVRETLRAELATLQQDAQRRALLRGGLAAEGALEGIAATAQLPQPVMALTDNAS